MRHNALSIGNYIKHNWALFLWSRYYYSETAKRITFGRRQQTQRACQ